MSSGTRGDLNRGLPDTFQTLIVFLNRLLQTMRRRGWLELTPRSIEQGHTQFCLKFSDDTAYGGLRYVQSIRRLSRGPVAVGHLEKLNLSGRYTHMD